MGMISGAFGAVSVGDNVVSTVNNWTINDSVTLNAYRASNTKRYPGRKRGTRTADGSFSGYGPLPPVFAGDSFIFRGFTGPSDGSETGPGLIYSVPAIANNLTMNWDFATGTFTSWEIGFTSNGALTKTTGTMVDNSYPTAMQPDPNKTIEIVGQDNEECVLNLVSVTLTFTNNVVTYANSCTGGWQRASAGSNDVTMSGVSQQDDLDIVPEVGTDMEIKIYVNGDVVDDEGTIVTPASYWHLKWMQMASKTGFTVDIETGAVIEFTMNAEFNGFSNGEKGIISYGNGTDDVIIWQPPATPSP